MSFNRYLPVMTIEGVDVPLKSFSFQAPSNSLGVRVDAEIADVTFSFERGDSCNFLLKNRGGADPRSRLIKNGRVLAGNSGIASARQQGLTVPNDTLSVSATDKIADKWKLAPRIPVILFDPDVITLQDGETNTNVNDAEGNRIYATATAIDDLDFIQILNFAYVEKCGFDAVVTNIPTYQIPRCDFPLNASYHSIAASFYSFFRPVVFEDDNRLFIVDIYGEIPDGILSGARAVHTDKYIVSQRQTPEAQIANAVLLTHKYVSVQDFDTPPANVTYRSETDIQEAGEYGTDGWQQTLFTQVFAQIHDDPEDPAKITNEFVKQTIQTVYGKDENGVIRQLAVETQTEHYSNNWRLNIGYEKTLVSYAEDTTDGSLPIMRNIQTETCQIQWNASQIHTGEYDKVWSRTQVEGLVIVEDEDTADETKTPLLEAARNHTVPKDGSPIRRMPITSKTERYRSIGADQIEVQITVIDHLSHRTEQTKTTPHVGTNSVRVKSGEAFNTRTVLIVDEDSDTENGAREPLSFDAGFVQYAIAKELALRELDLVNSPKDLLRCQLTTFDAGLRRGSIRKVFDRNGDHKKVIVTGYEVQGVQAARGQIVIQQSMEGVVIG